MADLEFELHKAQELIFLSDARFKVVGAGRRFGKSWFARTDLLVKTLMETNDYGYDLTGRHSYYIAPTFQQAKDIMWEELKRMAQPVTKKIRENECVLTLVNDRQIHLKGSDRPDTLRGVGLGHVVMDEYAFMKPDVWTAIVRPILADVKGSALFIGTPAGKNHFYDLFISAQANPDWEAFTFKSLDNPFLDPGEIAAAAVDMPMEFVKQEFEASFSSFGGTVFKEEFIQIEDRKPQGSVYITVDPAGYEDVRAISMGQKSKLDETAIAVVDVSPQGWHVLDVQHGRWDVRETSLRVLRAAQKYKPVSVGIEKGALKNALMPFLHDNMRRLNVFPYIREVSHGNKKKTDRIVWALQGRLEQGRLSLQPGEYTKPLVEQMLDFPNPTVHDDMLDALAYIDQIAVTSYYDAGDCVQDTFYEMEEITGL